MTCILCASKYLSTAETRKSSPDFSNVPGLSSVQEFLSVYLYKTGRVGVENIKQNYGQIYYLIDVITW